MSDRVDKQTDTSTCLERDTTENSTTFATLSLREW